MDDVKYGKHSSLQQFIIDYVLKIFYDTGLIGLNFLSKVERQYKNQHKAVPRMEFFCPKISSLGACTIKLIMAVIYGLS